MDGRIKSGHDGWGALASGSRRVRPALRATNPLALPIYKRYTLPGRRRRAPTGDGRPAMAQMNVRTSEERLRLFDRAAAIRGVTRSEFVLRASEAAAIEVLNERPIIALDDDAWDAFTAALDAPADPDPAVKARFRRQPQWTG